MRRLTRSWPLAVLALTLVSSGCGSTVEARGHNGVAGLAGSASTGAPSGNAQSLNGGGAHQAAGGSSGIGSSPGGAGGAGDALGSAGRAGRSATANRHGSTGAGTASTSGGAGVPATGHGWDAKNVYVGVITEKDTQQVYAQFGAKNADPGDTQAQATAMANEINAHGGILGRHLSLRFYDLATIATAENPASVGQAACTHFTQDAPVIAVWNVNTQIDQVPTFRTCLASGKVMLFTAAARAIDDREMASLAPYYVHTIMVSWNALAPVFAHRLQAQGWLGGWNVNLGRPGSGRAKIGILTDSTPEGAQTGALLKSAFAQIGYPNAATFEYGDPGQGQSSSVQYFHGHGVTHVIVTDVELTAFQSAAESQHYYPRYGITSYNDPYSNLEQSGLTPAGQNNGAMGVGWAPNLDVGDANDPGHTAGGRKCLATMTRAHQTFPNKRLAALFAFSGCDTFSLIARGATAGDGFSAAAIMAGIVRIGPHFSPANGFSPALRPGRPYVQGSVRDLAWNSSCKCMRYGSTTTTL